MRKFAVFDIDGTLIRWQLYHAVVDRLAKKDLLGPDAHEQLHKARMKWKRREHGEAFREYEYALISVYESAFGDLSTQAFDETTAEIIKEYGDQTYVYTRQLVKDLKAKGYMLLAISGSHQELVQHIADLYGFDDCIGSAYGREEDRFSGEIYVASQNKGKILKDMIDKHHLTKRGSVAVGDSTSDAEMLELVERPIAFNPDQNLYQIARKHGWKIVVERKNVIYELGANNGQYELA